MAVYPLSHTVYSVHLCIYLPLYLPPPDVSTNCKGAAWQQTGLLLSFPE